ncbi:hypothetical protein FB446DRAFT_748933 [Lentinula raphanica]|nr:hypothetical protein FB446DRAFT_748933 [Lentinula raphanica]
MILPNELFHSIVDFIAYKPILPDSSSLPDSRSLLKSASPELLALSVADWQLRRICLPFLFANLTLWRITDANRLEEHLALCSQFTKSLNIGPEGGVSETVKHIIIQNLPRLKQLSEVQLRSSRRNTGLLRALLVHPGVKSILIRDLPDKSMCDADLSKVILNPYGFFTVFPSEYEEFLDRGMRLLCLRFAEPLLIDQSLGSRVFSGLEEIQMRMGSTGQYVSFSFLPVLLTTHPNLKKLWIHDDAQLSYFTRHAPPFIASFAEASQGLDLKKAFHIIDIGLCRSPGQSSNEWSVMGLTLKTTTASASLIEILSLVASSFPQLEVLRLDVMKHKPTYHINDLTTVFQQFLSLKTLYLLGVYDRLDFGSNQELPYVHEVDFTDALDVLCARAETGLLWFISKVAREARSLDMIYLSDDGYDNGNNRLKAWHLSGWLLVLDGMRNVGGTLKRADNESEVQLDTRMLPPGLVS